ncbi:DUF2066 domain-containing protein [Thiomicrorhabdus cannonii]|uniref:DUF2066 domain-containing protein n=1 Tax=Thiomicrorhabdus cannonii TaxID=2748011 RepID=UPI0015BC4382|nr:DUF2066 domain-containing protein [Thiomicrorhabdus cannonii]
MRQFVLGVGLTLCVTAHAEQGALSNVVNSAAPLDEQALFTLVEGFDPEVDASGQVVKTPDLNQKILQGMRDLLLRLTGDASLLQSEEGREFIRDAKSWLTRYAFEPRKEEGVTVGQNLRLEFDRQRLLKAFQGKNIIVWPQKERPKTLVMGSFLQEGGILKLTPEALGYRPDIEFRPYPKLLALPLALPVKESSWVYPLADSVAPEQIQALLKQSGSQYLLSFRLEKSLRGENALLWRLYDQSGQSVLSASTNGPNGLALTAALFDRLMAFYSESYRQSASVLGAAVIGINRLSSAEQLMEIERYLQSQRPAVHQATLVALQGGRAEFEVVYQGRYQDLLNVCMGIEGAKLQSQSALTARIEVLLPGLMERPATQLIDLSKEYEANTREGL